MNDNTIFPACRIPPQIIVHRYWLASLFIFVEVTEKSPSVTINIQVIDFQRENWREAWRQCSKFCGHTWRRWSVSACRNSRTYHLLWHSTLTSPCERKLPEPLIQIANMVSVLSLKLMLCQISWNPLAFALFFFPDCLLSFIIAYIDCSLHRQKGMVLLLKRNHNSQNT